MIKSRLAPKLFFAQSIVLAAALNCFGLDTTNAIKREIRCENGVLWVDDSLHVSADFSVSENVLSHVFNAGKDQSTNLINCVRTLMQDEDLEIQSCSAKYKEPFLDLKIVSKVVFKHPLKPAALNWLSTFGGTNPGLGGADPKQYEARLLLFASDGQYVLLVPSLTREDYAMEEMAKFGFTYDSFFARGEPIEFECTLANSHTTERLLSWKPSCETRNAPKPALIKQMDETYKMSGNDQLTLCTALKIARAGYYGITSTGTTTNGH